eukprot:SAG25_NODE_2018_length_2021_cov_2.213840_2_plen_49_part_01
MLVLDDTSRDVPVHTLQPLAICGKVVMPAQLMATYLLGEDDFYISHKFA